MKISAQETAVTQNVDKKAKKRPVSEIIDDSSDTIEKPKAKKKLKILKQVDDSSQFNNNKKSNNNRNNSEAIKVPANLTSKLNRLIPKGLGNGEKQVVKKKKKLVFEQKKELKRPVWTTAGTFLEESVKPYTFKTTEYKPINIGSSAFTQHSVVAFSAKKKSVPNSVDFKMQQMMKRSKNRDKSIKNLKNLM